MNFEIGQRVRIVGPTIFNEMHHIGKCFVIEEKDDPEWDKIHGCAVRGYSKHDCPSVWPATSLELAPLVLDSIDFLHDPLPHGMSEIEVLAVRAVNHFNAIEKRLQALENKEREPPRIQDEEDTDYKLYRVICEKPGSGVYDLAKEMGWSSKDVYSSIRRLVRGGWVAAVREGQPALKIQPVKWYDFLTPEEIEEFEKGDSGVRKA